MKYSMAILDKSIYRKTTVLQYKIQAILSTLTLNTEHCETLPEACIN